MRDGLRYLAVAVMMAVAVAARAQDAGIAAAQQAAQISQQASQQAVDSMNQASQTAQTQMQMAQQAAANGSYGRPRPRLPMTPAPVMTPSGGSFKGSVQVAIVDADTRAIVFYTTDGSVPTPRSQRYAGPIVVSGREKVRALAFDLELMPSGVVSRVFKVKV